MKSPALLFIITGLAIAGLAAFGPPEKTLGENVRIVYLHGAWVWTSLICLGLAALTGFTGLVHKSQRLLRWSRSLGRTGVLFWVAYLPLSMWASQANWNGLYLAEPRWRVAFIFAVTGVLLQIGLALLERPAWTAAANLLYFLALVYALATAERVMHPPSPIFSSDSLRIQIFFILLVALTLLLAGLVAREWQRFER